MQTSPQTPLYVLPGAVRVASGCVAGSARRTDAAGHRLWFETGAASRWMEQGFMSLPPTASAAPMQDLQPVGRQQSCDVTVDRPVFLLSRINNLNPFHSAQDWVLTYLSYATLDLSPLTTDVWLADLMLPGPHVGFAPCNDLLGCI